MIDDEKERRSPSQVTIDNTIAIGKLTAISERTTSDVDKLVRHIEKFLPVHEKIQNLKIILYSSVATAVMFGVWITLQYFALSSTLSTYMAVCKVEDEQLYKEVTDKINRNKNQITYIKGRIK